MIHPRPAARRLCLALAWACLFLGGPWLAGAESTRSSFSVPGGDAALTLRQLSRQARESVVFPIDLVHGVQTHPVQGEFTAREAAERMTAGTELFVSQDPQTGALLIARRVPPELVAAQLNPSRIRSPSGSNFVPVDHMKPSTAKLRKFLSIVSGVLLAANSDSNGQTASNLDRNASDRQGEVVKLGAYQVSGSFARSIEIAVDAKKNADTTVEVVSPEDLGRLPDVSVADALSRLPGISSQRTSGQASAINIRGLSQQLTFATLNGREQVTLNGDRTVEFEQYPSELLAGATVYKSPKASLLEGGIGGTVELQTVRPLDYEERKLTFNTRGSYSNRAGEIYDAREMGYRFSVSYVDQFLNDKFGVAFGYARLEQPDIAARFVGFNSAAGEVDFDRNGVSDVVSFGFDGELAGGKDERNGMMGTLEWRPSDRLTWSIDAYLSDFSSRTFKRQLGTRVFTQVTNPAWVRVENPIVVGDALVGGQFTRLRPAGQNGLRVQTVVADVSDRDRLVSLGSKLTYALTDRLKATIDVSYSKAESRAKNFVFVHLPLDIAPPTPRFNRNVFLDFAYNGIDLPTINSISPDLGNPASMYLTNANSAPTDNDDELFAVATNFKYEIGRGIFSSLDVGLRQSTRDAAQFRNSFNRGTVNGASFSALTPIALTSANSVTLGFHGRFSDSGFPRFSTIIDPEAAVIAASGPIVYDSPPANFVLEQSFTVSEDIFSGYAQANLDTHLMGVPLTGNLGLRVLETKQSSAARSTRAPGGITYARVLPAANFVLHLSERDRIRLAASRAITRPPLLGLGAGFALSFNGSTLVGGGTGNPALLPYLANQADLSYERYFKHGGALAIGAFYKSLDSFIVNDQDDSFDFSRLNLRNLLSPSDFTQFQQAGSPSVGILNGTINGRGGYVRGLEFNYTRMFDRLPSPFNGFGVIANYSYTESAISFTSSASGVELSLPLPGLSAHVTNGTLFYEKGGFSTRVGLRHRSEFVSPQQALGQQLPYTNAETVLDYQVSYRFHQGPLSGLTLLLQVNNLTDEPVITYFGQQAQTGTIQYFGRQLLVGASYNF